MKKSLFVIISFITVIGILIYSLKNVNSDDNNSYISDVKVNENVLDKILTVNYVGGNMIDETLEYGNSIKKEIEVVNSNSEMVVFALSLAEKENNNYLKYSINATKNGIVENLVKNKELNDNILVYNLIIEPNSKLVISTTITSNKEGTKVNAKGKFKVVSNLTDKELFIESIKKTQKLLLSKIDALNGIRIPGFYKLNVDILSKDVNGSIVIDATDIANLVYYYSVTNGKYMIDNYKYKDEIGKSSVQSGSIVLGIEDLCKSHSKKGCLLFSDLPVNSSGGKKEFYNDSKRIINLVKGNIKLSSKKVYVIDVVNDIAQNTNIRGYILIDNTADNPEYFIYLTDNLFMISGYNYTKYGDYTESSSTIRAYKESAFNLSASDKLKVCLFSGYTSCVNANGENIN